METVFHYLSALLQFLILVSGADIPSNIRYTLNGTTVNATWNHVSHQRSQGYSIECKTFHTEVVKQTTDNKVSINIPHPGALCKCVIITSAAAASGVQSRSTPHEIQLGLEPVPNLYIEKPTPWSLAVSWQAASGYFEKYAVNCFSNDINSADRIVFASATELSATCRELTPGTFYSLHISAMKPGLTTVSTNTITNAKTKIGLFPVTNLMVTTRTPTSISVRWTKAKGFKDKYTLMCYTSDGGAPGRSEVGEHQLGATCNKLTPGTNYTVKVWTGLAGFEQVGSEGLTATTKLDQVLALAVSNRTSNSLTVTWNHATNSRGGYNLKCDHPDPLVIGFSINLGKWDRTGTCTGLSAGVMYTVRVATRRLGWDDTQATLQSQTTRTRLAPVTNIIVVKRTSSLLTVAWNHTTFGKHSYLVKCFSTLNTTTATVHVPGQQYTATCRNLTATVRYSIAITTKKSGWREVTSTLRDYTTHSAPEAVTGVQVVSAEDQWIKVNWTRAAGAHKYKVTCSTLRREAQQRRVEVPLYVSVAKCTNLSPGLVYTITVSTMVEGFPETTSLGVTNDMTKIKLQPVTEVVISQRATSLVVSWRKANGFPQFYVVDCTPKDPGNLKSATEKVMFYTNSVICRELRPGSSYEITVTTVKIGWSNISTIAMSSTLLDTVSKLQLTAKTTRSVAVSWHHASPSYHGYMVTCTSNDQQTTKSSATLSSQDRNCTCNQLTPGSLYSVRVTTTKTRWQGSTIEFLTKTDLTPVTGLRVKTETSSSLSVTWSPSIGNKDRYRFSCHSNDDGLYFETFLSADSNKSKCVGLKAGSTYTVIVTTERGRWTNVESNTEGQTALTNATHLKILASSASSLTARWRHAWGRKEAYILECVSAERSAMKKSIQVMPDQNEAVCDGLTPGTSYSLRIVTKQSKWKDAISDWKQDGSTISKLERVTSISVTNQTSTSITVAWKHAPGNKQGYTLKCIGRKNVLGDTVYVGSDFATSTCNGLTPGSLYSIRVFTNRDGWLPIFADSPLTSRTDLAEVSNISIKGRDNSSLRITWRHAAGNHHNYSVHCSSTDPGAAAFRREVKPSVNMSTCEHLTPGSLYTVSVTTKLTGWPDVTGPRLQSEKTKTELSIPTGLRTAPLTTSIRLSWLPAKGGVEKQIVKCINKGLAVSSSELSPAVTKGTCTQLTPGTLYRVVIAHKRTGWLDVHSEVAKVKTKISAVTGLRVVHRTATSLAVSWIHFDGNKDAYHLTCTPSSQRKVKYQADVPAHEDLATCTGLSPGTSYSVQVATKLNTWPDVLSEVVRDTSTRTFLAPVPWLQVTVRTMSSLSVVWRHSPSTKDHYVVECFSGVGNTVNDKVTVNDSTNSAVCTQLTPGVAYAVTVTAKQSGWKDVTSYSLNDSSTRTKLSRVSGMQVTTAVTSIRINWSHASGMRERYTVKCTPIGLNTTSTSTTVGSSINNVSCNDLQPGTEYVVTVTTQQNTWANESSSIRAKTLLERVSDVHVRSSGETLVVTWLPVIGGHTKYKVTYQAASRSVVLNVPPQETGVMCGALAACELHNFTVSTWRSGWKENASDLVEDASGPWKSTQIAHITSTSSITITWQAPEGGGVLRYNARILDDGKVLEFVKESQDRQAHFTGLLSGIKYNVQVRTICQTAMGKRYSDYISKVVATRLNGGWNSWQPWTDCKCLYIGAAQLRHRLCNKPRPRYGGLPCPLDNGSESRICQNQYCEGWSPFSNWTDCDVTCGLGTRSRSRRCFNPKGKPVQKLCVGSSTQTMACGGPLCPQQHRLEKDLAVALIGLFLLLALACAAAVVWLRWRARRVEYRLEKAKGVASLVPAEVLDCAASSMERSGKLGVLAQLQLKGLQSSHHLLKVSSHVQEPQIESHLSMTMPGGRRKSLSLPALPQTKPSEATSQTAVHQKFQVAEKQSFTPVDPDLTSTSSDSDDDLEEPSLRDNQQNTVAKNTVAKVLETGRNSDDLDNVENQAEEDSDSNTTSETSRELDTSDETSPSPVLPSQTNRYYALDESDSTDKGDISSEDSDGDMDTTQKREEGKRRKVKKRKKPSTRVQKHSPRSQSTKSTINSVNVIGSGRGDSEINKTGVEKRKKIKKRRTVKSSLG